MKGNADGFNLSRETVPAVFAVTLLMFITVSTIAAVKYPPSLSESSPVNKETGECLFHGVNHNFWAGLYRNNCNYVYGNMTGDNYEFPLFHQIINFTGCMVFTGLDKLEKLPLSSIQMLRANTDFCKYNYALLVYGNENLKQINMKKSMDIKGKEVFIKANRQLRREQVINAPFDVDVGTAYDCTMEMALKRKDCKTLVGDVIYPGDAYMKDVWSKITKVYGTVTADSLSEPNLGFLQNVTVHGWLPRVVSIVNNHKNGLRHISEVLKMSVSGPEPHFWFHNNTSFCHTADIRKQIEAKTKTKLSWDKECLTRCAGGKLNSHYLNGVGKLCYIIDGDLVIEGLEAQAVCRLMDHELSDLGCTEIGFSNSDLNVADCLLRFTSKLKKCAKQHCVIGSLTAVPQKGLPPNIGKLAQIEQINGRLIVKKNTGVPNLYFLQNLEQIQSSKKGGPTLDVADNRNFAFKGMTAIKKVHGDTLVSTERADDVPKDVKNHITRITDGSAKFISKQAATTTKTTASTKQQTKSASVDKQKSSESLQVATTERSLAHKQEADKNSKRSDDSESGPSLVIPIVIVILLLLFAVLIAVGVAVGRHYWKKKHPKKQTQSKKQTKTSPKEAPPPSAK